MTREEAIKHLSEWMDEKMWICFGTIDREAIGIAIKALSADTISREEAIHAIDLCRERKNKEIDELRTKWLEAERRADRPTGVWVDKGGYSECSECGEVAQSMEFYDGVYERLTKFCPNCGAKMLREDNEE